MTRIIDTKSKCRLSAKLAAGFVISGVFTLGTFAGSASAQERYPDRGYRHHWSGGYIAPRQWSTAHHIAGDTMASHIIPRR